MPSHRAFIKEVLRITDRDDAVRRALAELRASLAPYTDEVIRICEIPAPTFAEAERGAYVSRRFTEAGLTDVTTDDVGNVYGWLPGGKDGPAVLLAAHLDTVFPAGTDCTVRRGEGTLHAPGIGDNCSNLAALIVLAEVLQRTGVRFRRRIAFAATVGEEGLGDLRGMRRLFADLQQQLGAVIAVDGGLGNLVHEAIASRRYRITCRAGGGHSWSHFGMPSAIHALGRIIAQLSEMDVPAEPRTTFNVGVIEGGTSVNTIAAEASLLLDLRSVAPACLAQLDREAQRIWTTVAREAGVTVTADLIGDRPGGHIPASHPLCQAVRAVHQELGIATHSLPSSTDANIPLSAGVPAVTIGVTTGGNGHRLDEYIHLAPVPTGLQQLLLLLQRLDAPGALA